jgi:acylphosphatase
VEVEATGSSEALALFAGALHRGPPSARVEEVVRESSVPSEADDFVILR